MAQLDGRAALVTGGSQGIGKAICLALAGAGASVAVNYRSGQGAAQAVVETIEAAGGRAIAVKGDVASPEDVQAMVSATVEAFGSLDILVNNAALYDMSRLEEIDAALFQLYFATNLQGPLLLAREALAHMREGGSIINVSSTITFMPEPATALYAATKAGLNMLTEVLAKELGGRGIRVNTMSPGVTHTDGHPVDDWDDAIIQPLRDRTALGRTGRPDEIASVAVFLASDEARWVTGANLRVSGGLT